MASDRPIVSITGNHYTVGCKSPNLPLRQRYTNQTPHVLSVIGGVLLFESLIIVHDLLKPQFPGLGYSVALGYSAYTLCFCLITSLFYPYFLLIVTYYTSTLARKMRDILCSFGVGSTNPSDANLYFYGWQYWVLGHL